MEDQPIDMAGPPARNARRTRLQTAGLSVLAVMIATAALSLITMSSSSGASAHGHITWFGFHRTEHVHHGHHKGGHKTGTPDDGGAGAAGGCGGG